MAKDRYYYLQQGSRIIGKAEGASKDFTEAEAIAIGKAFSNWLIYKVGKNPAAMQVCIGIDNRKTSKDLAIAVMKGLHAFGTVTGYAGEATGPAMALSASHPFWEFDGAIMVTAGDKGERTNGFTLYHPGGMLTEKEVTEVLEMAAIAYLSHEEYEIMPVSLMPIYASVLRSNLSSLDGIKIAVDTSNMAGRFFAEKVLAEMKAEIVDESEASICIAISRDGESCKIKKDGKSVRIKSDEADGMLQAVKYIKENI